jgi:hypothetical protein
MVESDANLKGVTEQENARLRNHCVYGRPGKGNTNERYVYLHRDVAIVII